VPFPPGTRLGPYEIRKVSPVPGLGEVYDARDHEQGRDVSLTVVRTDFAGDPDRLERFQRDASAAALVEHPHILTVYNVGADGQAAYIVSEPIQGRTLREVRAAGPIPPGAGAQFVPQIAEALTAAHEKGVVHGNLKPDHILFTTDGVKVIGFGLAAATGNTEATVSGDLAAFDAISEMLTGAPRAKSRGSPVEAASGRGWPGVAAAVGVIAFAALIAVWLFGGNDRPATAEPEAVASEPVITEAAPATADPPLSGPPSPDGFGAAAPTTEGTEPAPTTQKPIAPEPVPPAPAAPKGAIPAREPPVVAAEPSPRSPRSAPARSGPPQPAPASRPRAAPVATPQSIPAAPPKFTSPAPVAAVPRDRLSWRRSRLVWLTGEGTEATILREGEDYGDISFSPDATRVAVSIRERDGAGGDIWIIDAGSGARTQLTSDLADDIAPIWSPDGSRVAFASWRDGTYDIYEKAGDSAGFETVIVSAPGDQIASDWTPGQKFLLYQTDQPGVATGANLDLWARSWPARGRPFAFLRTVHAASQPSSSPDGRRVAFTLFGNGREDVYIARFPHYDGRRRISPAGGSWPRWRGNTIFYVDTQGQLASVPITIDGNEAVPGVPTTLSRILLKPNRGYPYDVAADGQRILINAAVAGSVTLSQAR
jgi:serine/threonine protein kinase